MGSVPILGFVLGLLIVAGLCNGASTTTLFQVIGAAECSDCQAKNIKPTHAFSGLGVTIDCKDADGEVKRKGYGEMDKEGNFKVLADGVTPKDECYAQLHGASGIPCSTEGGAFVVEQSKTSEEKGEKVILRPVKKLKFSSETCTSAFLWPYYKFPPLPDQPNWFHKPILSFPPHKGFGLPPFPWHLPKKKLPCPIFKKPLPPIPIYKKPIPPPAVPVYVKPIPPPVPVYVKPLPPPVPVYEKPNPPPVPVYKKKPSPPKYKKQHPPPAPVYKKKPCPPIYKKPLPPLPHLPPIYKKPLPPLPHFPPIYKKPLPPLPHFPPIYKKPLPPLPHFPPIYKKPLPPLPHFPPIYKKPLPPLPHFPPIYKKPLPPLPQFPPIYKKPLPPLPQFPPIYKKPLPPLPKFPPITLPKIPPKFFQHPKIKHLPSLPWVPPHA